MKIYNTLTKSKEEFKTNKENEVDMYVCGPTVYDLFHIGNARVFIVFDAFRSFLEYKGYKVNYIQNFTDVDDKIINKSKKENVNALDISRKYIDEYFKDADSLKVNRASKHPKVSECIDEIIEFIDGLIKKDFAYEIDGDVFYDVKKNKNYGSLSKQNIDELVSGARIGVDTKKKDPLDFALWKRKKEGEISWKSPWGEGRPGWHIECSAMIKEYLGENIDIHAGGHDLIFPHHENELAQSESLNDKKLANYWMHAGYINIDNKKMSKSKGNFFTVRDILMEYSPEEIRFFILSVHYRNPVNFSKELIESTSNALERLVTFKENLEYNLNNKNESDDGKEKYLDEFNKYKSRYVAALDDDFNTSDAIGVLFEFVRYVNVEIKNEVFNAYKEALDLFVELTDIFRLIPEKEQELLENEIIDLINQREEARKNKDYKRADEIRDILKQKNIVLEDRKDGVKWSIVK